VDFELINRQGSRGLAEIAGALEGMRLGISFLTPDNLKEPWILYEAGCLTKTVDDKTYLCTYLLDGLKHEDIEPPLGQFQHTVAEKDETAKLLRTINRAVSANEPISDLALERIFERSWPDFEAKLRSIPPTMKEVPKRQLPDMVAEILDLVRAQTNVSSGQITLTREGVPLLRAFGSLPPSPDWFSNVTVNEGETQASKNVFRDRALGRVVTNATEKAEETDTKRRKE
jgi:hypothetical protein